MDPHEDVVRREAPDELREAYWLGQMYMLLEHYAESMDQFLSLQKKFPDNKYAATAQMHIHACQAKLATKARDWSKAESNLDTAAGFIRNGAAALGVGSSLVNQKLLDEGNLDELTRRAAAYIQEVRKGRGL